MMERDYVKDNPTGLIFYNNGNIVMYYPEEKNTFFGWSKHDGVKASVWKEEGLNTKEVNDITRMFK